MPEEHRGRDVYEDGKQWWQANYKKVVCTCGWESPWQERGTGRDSAQEQHRTHVKEVAA